ncbi:MAG TPA: flagellar hook-basal body complex protein FliE [Chloroflexota bacterium]|nr:flagellar hook-basal body complex protein FliE [Chloroflexota bacterium]
MAFLPISPLSPDLTLVKPIGASESRLGPIPNVADGIPGIGGIGKVELPGVGVFTPGWTGLGAPSLPDLSAPAAAASPISSATPVATTTPVPGVSPSPEVTPFPNISAQPTTTPTPGTQPSAQVAPTPQVSATPQATSTPVPNAGALQQPAQGSPYSTPAITTNQVPALVQTPFTPETTSNIPVKQTPLAETFGKYLKDAASNYSETQAQADSMIQHLAVGDKVDIQDVAMAVQKAAISNQLAIQVRNRLVEAYQEMMRMPV